MSSSNWIHRTAARRRRHWLQRLAARLIVIAIAGALVSFSLVIGAEPSARVLELFTAAISGVAALLAVAIVAMTLGEFFRD